MDRQDFLDGALKKQMIIFAVPLVLTSVLLQLFNTADTAMAGRFIGKDALAAVGGTVTFTSFLIEFFLGFSNAVNVIIARFLGMNDSQRANNAVYTSVTISLFLGIAMGILGFCSVDVILDMMMIPDNIIESAAAYLRIYFTGIPFLMLYNFCAAVFRSKGCTKIPMVCLVMGGILKLAENFIFVVVLDFGITGMAISTVCANALSAGLLIWLLHRRDDEIRLACKLKKLDKDCILSVLKIGLPSSFLGSVFSVSNLCVQASINSLGSDVMAACSAAIGIEIYIQFFGNAFAQTATTFTSQNYGAGRIERLNKITVTALVLCNTVTVTLSFLAFGMSNSLLRIFVTDAAVIALARTRMIYTLLFKPVQAVMDIMSGCLQGYGYTLVPAVISAFTVCGVRLLWVYTVFAHNRTLETLMFIYPITQGMAALSHTICYIFLLRKIKRKAYE